MPVRKSNRKAAGKNAPKRNDKATKAAEAAAEAAAAPTSRPEAKRSAPADDDDDVFASMAVDAAAPSVEPVAEPVAEPAVEPAAELEPAAEAAAAPEAPALPSEGVDIAGGQPNTVDNLPSSLPPLPPAAPKLPPALPPRGATLVTNPMDVARVLPEICADSEAWSANRDSIEQAAAGVKPSLSEEAIEEIAAAIATHPSIEMEDVRKIGVETPPPGAAVGCFAYWRGVHYRLCYFKEVGAEEDTVVAPGGLGAGSVRIKFEVRNGELNLVLSSFDPHLGLSGGYVFKAVPPRDDDDDDDDSSSSSSDEDDEDDGAAAATAHLEINTSAVRPSKRPKAAVSESDLTPEERARIAAAIEAHANDKMAKLEEAQKKRDDKLAAEKAKVEALPKKIEEAREEFIVKLIKAKKTEVNKKYTEQNNLSRKAHAAALAELGKQVDSISTGDLKAMELCAIEVAAQVCAKFDEKAAEELAARNKITAELKQQLADLEQRLEECKRELECNKIFDTLAAKEAEKATEIEKLKKEKTRLVKAAIKRQEQLTKTMERKEKDEKRTQACIEKIMATTGKSKIEVMQQLQEETAAAAAKVAAEKVAEAEAKAAAEKAAASRAAEEAAAKAEAGAAPAPKRMLRITNFDGTGNVVAYKYLPQSMDYNVSKGDIVITDTDERGFPCAYAEITEVTDYGADAKAVSSSGFDCAEMTISYDVSTSDGITGSFTSIVATSLSGEVVDDVLCSDGERRSFVLTECHELGRSDATCFYARCFAELAPASRPDAKRKADDDDDNAAPAKRAAVA